MATIEKRIQVTPSARIGGLLREISAITGQPLSSMIRELLEDAAPVLHETLTALQAIKAAKRAGEAEAVAAAFFKGVEEHIAKAQLDVRNVQQELDLEAARRRKRGRKPKAKGKGGPPSG